MVLETSVDRQAPITLSTAATRTARLGVKAPVATDVAMALDESWKPLVKSKTRAVTTTTITRKRMVLIPFTMGDWVTLSTALTGGRRGPGRLSATHQYCYPLIALLPNQSLSRLATSI